MLETLALSREIRAAHPTWCRSLSVVEVLSPGHLRLAFAELPFPLVVRAENALERILLFDRLRDQVVERFGLLEHVDLRATSRVVLLPAEAGVATGDVG